MNFEEANERLQRARIRHRIHPNGRKDLPDPLHAVSRLPEHANAGYAFRSVYKVWIGEADELAFLVSQIISEKL
jgi:hypothetical protein